MPPERKPREPHSSERSGERQREQPSAKQNNAKSRVIDFKNASGMIWRGPDYPLLTPGKYEVRGTLFQGPVWVRSYHRWSLRIEFALTTEPGSVSAFYNFGDDKDGKKIGRQSRYYKAWVIANGEHPRRGQVMTPDVFLEGQFFEVEVETCDKDSEGNLKPEAEHYSRIVKIISARRV